MFTVTEPRQLQELVENPNVLVLAFYLEGSGITADAFKNWLASFPTAQASPGSRKPYRPHQRREPRTSPSAQALPPAQASPASADPDAAAFEKFRTAMKLKPTPSNRKRFEELQQVQLGGPHLAPRHWESLTRRGIHTLADLCSHSLAEIEARTGFVFTLIDSLHAFAKDHGVKLPK